MRNLNVSEVMLLACNGMLNLSPEVLVMVRDRELDVDDDTAARAHNTNKTTVEVLMMPPNDSNGPYMTETPPGEMEPVPYAMRNYDWTPDEIGAIAQLDTQLRKLRELRQRSCDEAEALWQWLALSECEYYSSKVTCSDPEELKSIKKYLIMLSQRHALVWLQISKWDWIIADAQKQLELARSADFTREPRETAKLVSHASARSAKLTHTLQGLDRRTTHGWHGVRDTKMALVQLGKILHADHITSDQKKMIEQQIKYHEQMLQVFEDDWAMSQVLAKDASERSKGSNSTSTR